jgi:DNA repair exonuclease SbcCD ATPase subunit
MKVQITDVKLKNFRNFKEKQITLTDITAIYGKNGLGKTGFIHAIFWLLVGKNYSNEADFDIKPIDKKGNQVHNLETEVEATILIDGETNIIKRILKENWTTKRGSAEKELTGNTTDYYINEVPKKKREFDKWVLETVGDEDTIRELTNPSYFAEISKWDVRRKRLFALAGKISQDDVVAQNSDLKGMVVLLGSRTIDEYRKVQNDQKLKLKKDLDAIPARIDEVNNQFVDYDVDDLNEQLAIKQKELVDVENILEGESTITPEEAENKKMVATLEARLKELRKVVDDDFEKKQEEYSKQIRSTKQRKTDYESELQITEQTRATKYRDLEATKVEKDTLKKSFEETRAEVHKPQPFVDHTVNCPNCNYNLNDFLDINIEETQEEYSSRIAEEKKNFIDIQKAELEAINKKGHELSNKIDSIAGEIKTLDEKIIQLQSEIDSLTKEILALAEERESLEKAGVVYPNEVQKVSAELEELKSKKFEASGINFDELRTKKQFIIANMDEIKSQLNQVDNNKKLKARINQLGKEQKETAQRIADYEKQIFLCQEYMRIEAELYETKVNAKFNKVTWKLFNQQINGGLEPCCEALINGVPFKSANNAARINAGIDIINTMSDIKDLSLPIFVDNAEAVNDLELTSSQLIATYVSEDEQLKIEVR